MKFWYLMGDVELQKSGVYLMIAHVFRRNSSGNVSFFFFFLSIMMHTWNFTVMSDAEVWSV